MHSSHNRDSIPTTTDTNPSPLSHPTTGTTTDSTDSNHHAILDPDNDVLEDENENDFDAVSPSSTTTTSSSTTTTTPSFSQLKLSYESQFLDAKRQYEQITIPLYQQTIISYPYTKTQLEQLISDYDIEQSQEHFWLEGNQVRTQQVHTHLSECTRLLQRLQQWEVWYGDATAALEILLEVTTTTTTTTTGPATTTTTTTASTASIISNEERDLLLDEFITATKSLHRDCTNAEIEFILSGPYDDCPARLVITAGAGGIEAMDWVADLTRMYIRYAERHYGSTSVTKIDWNDSFSGYKSMELLIRGPKAYGYLQCEKGSHRLVRISPYNAMGKRQTTFATVDVTPELPPSLLNTLNDIQIPDTELEVTTMRSPGKGGQHVNKVSSGVRMKHIPSGITVRCTEERSQLANRNIAMHRLKTQLLLIAQEQRVQTIRDIRGDILDTASWGTQIRSYILHPYRLVKDTRTGWETTLTQEILNGSELLDDCIHTYLQHKANTERQEANDAALQQ